MANTELMNGLPFDAKMVDGEWDRTAFSADIAKYLGSLYTNGVLVATSLGETLTNQLRVTGGDLIATVNVGNIIILGKLGWITETKDLDINPNTIGSDRVDNIVVEKSDLEADRAFQLKVIQGVAGSGSPILTRNQSVYQMCLAQVTVAKNSSVISSIVDTRSNATLCGIANLVVGPKSISGIDEIRLVASEPTDAASQAEPRVMFVWAEQ